jgi:1-deoxy-D-xylulose 5-phosphate reductoisomerase
MRGQIKFTRILDLIEHCLDQHAIRHQVQLEDLMEADAWARDQVKKNLNTSL